jgi:hypothetical protein
VGRYVGGTVGGVRPRMDCYRAQVYTGEMPPRTPPKLATIPRTMRPAENRAAPIVPAVISEELARLDTFRTALANALHGERCDCERCAPHYEECEP